MKCSYIIAIQNDCDTQISRVLEWLNGLEIELEVIIIEQGDIRNFSPPKKFKHPIIHEFLINRGLFNKNWAYNIGIDRCASDTECVAFAEPDVVIKPTTFFRALETLKSYDLVKPFKYVTCLDQEQAFSLNLKDFNNAPLQGKNKLIQKALIFKELCSGLVFYSARGIQKVQGWDWRFRDTQYGDAAQSIKSNNLLFCKILKNSLWQLNHKPKKGPLDHDMEFRCKKLNIHYKYHFEEHKALFVNNFNTNRNLYADEA